MSTGKRIIYPYPVIGSTSSVSGSMSADITSIATCIKNMDSAGYQINWTGDAIGPLILQVSLDGETFSDLPNFAIISPNGADGGTYVDLTQVSAFWVRLFFDRTSGTGTMAALVAGKAY